MEEEKRRQEIKGKEKRGIGEMKKGKEERQRERRGDQQGVEDKSQTRGRGREVRHLL